MRCVTAIVCCALTSAAQAQPINLTPAPGTLTLTPSALSPAFRAPTPTDDAPHGYAIGNLWNVPGLGMWICQDATTGRAVWEPQPTGILPLDSVPGVTLHGYGTRRLRASYVGNPLAITPSGGMSTDVPFDASGNIDVHQLGLDIGAVPPVSVTSSPQMWSGAVTTWYDQSASVPMNATVPTGSVAPQISPLYLTGGSPVVAFADGGDNWLTDYSTTQNQQHPRLATVAQTFNATSFDVQIVGRNGSIGTGVSTAVTFQGTYPISISMTDPGNTGTPYAPASLTDGVDTPVQFDVPSSPSVLGFDGSSTALTAFDDDNNSFSGAAPIANAPANGLLMGGQSPTLNGFSVAMNAVIVGPTLTAAQKLALRESLTDTFKLTPQVRQRLSINGDSKGAGADGWETWAPLRFAEAGLDQPWLIYNAAIAGSQIGTSNGASATSEVTLFPSLAGYLYTSYALNVYVEEGGTNSLGQAVSVNGASATDAGSLADWSAFNKLVRGLGGNVRIVGQTLAPHTAITPDSLRVAYNAALLSAPYVGQVDAWDDIGNSPLLGNPTIVNSRIYTITAGTHDSPYYQSMEGPLLARAINQASGE